MYLEHALHIHTHRGGSHLNQVNFSNVPAKVIARESLADVSNIISFCRARGARRSLLKIEGGNLRRRWGVQKRREGLWGGQG